MSRAGPFTCDIRFQFLVLKYIHIFNMFTNVYLGIGQLRQVRCTARLGPGSRAPARQENIYAVDLHSHLRPRLRKNGTHISTLDYCDASEEGR